MEEKSKKCKTIKNERTTTVKTIHKANLISYVITAIIFTIILTVGMSLLLGEDSVIRIKLIQAKKGETTQLEIEKYNENLPENTKGTEAGTEVKMPSEWLTTTSTYVETEDEGIVEKVLVASNVNAIATGNGETVPVPKGFYYVGGTVQSGVVISDNKDDQNKYAGQANVPAGAIYNEDGTVKTYTDEEYKNLSKEEQNKVLLGNQFVWIPVTEENYEKVDWNKIVLGQEYSTSTWETKPHSSELVQIRKYGGFYVGRYEAGTNEIELSVDSKKIDFSAKNEANSWENDKFSIRDGLNNRTISGKITSKAGEIPYYHSDYFTALKLSNSMYQTDYVQSGLVTGTMWDAIMRFIAGNNTSIVTTNSTWGNYNAQTEGVTFGAGQGRYASVTSSGSNVGSNEAFTKSDEEYHYGIRTTASTEGVKQKNLYDIAGNLWEWTQEASYPNNTAESYMLRGGSFNDICSNYPACYRVDHTATNTRTHVGFRPALYIM